MKYFKELPIGGCFEEGFRSTIKSWLEVNARSGKSKVFLRILGWGGVFRGTSGSPGGPPSLLKTVANFNKQQDNDPWLYTRFFRWWPPSELTNLCFRPDCVWKVPTFLLLPRCPWVWNLVQVMLIPSFWTPGLPEGVLSICLCGPSVCPCVCVSVFKYLRDHSLVFSEIFHEVRAP